MKGKCNECLRNAYKKQRKMIGIRLRHWKTQIDRKNTKLIALDESYDSQKQIPTNSKNVCPEMDDNMTRLVYTKSLHFASNRKKYINCRGRMFPSPNTNSNHQKASEKCLLNNVNYSHPLINIAPIDFTAISAFFPNSILSHST